MNEREPALLKRGRLHFMYVGERVRFSRLTGCVAAVCVASSSAVAAPRLIDDFERGAIDDPLSPPGTVVDDTPDGVTCITGQPFLPGQHGEFLSRYESVNLHSGSSATWSLSPDAPDVNDDAPTIGLPAHASAAVMLGYDLASTDFLADGNDHLAFDVTGTSADVTIELGLGARINGAWRTVELQTLTLGGPGTYSFDLDALVGRDPAYPASTILHQVAGFEFLFPNLQATDAPRAVAIDDITLVPEPGIIPLGVTALTGRRRRRPQIDSRCS